jgi:hypothetical protein
LGILTRFGLISQLFVIISQLLDIIWWLLVIISNLFSTYLVIIRHYSRLSW